MRVAPYFVAFGVLILAIVGVRAGAWWAGLGIAFVFGAVPLLDAWLGRNTSNVGTDRGHDRAFDVPLYLWVGLQLLVQLWWVARYANAAVVDVELVLSTITIGLMSGGIGITVAHELMHRARRGDRALAELLMGSVSYTHFCIEHVHGHHRHVATARDPATSRLGESLYRFLPRTLLGGLVDAWAIEAERMVKHGHAPLSWRNRMVRYAAAQVLLYAALTLALGPIAAALWAAQAAVAVLMLEVVNYIEHYGLQRRELGDGRYERVAPWHSWNASHRLTNWLLLNLQRHSDHHFSASRAYDQLRHYDDVPQLPAGYATMVLLALVPPLWRRVMDPRVAAVTTAARAQPDAAAA